MSFWEEDVLCSILFYNIGRTMVYLFYLAVSPILWSKGYGRKLLLWLRGNFPDKIIVGNIEPTGFHAGNEEQRIRRAAFYERNGFHYVPYRLSDNSGLYDIISTGEGFSEDEYIRLIKELGFDVYHPVLLKIR